MTTLPWLVYRLTGSAMLLGLIGFLSQIFILILSPFAGAVADHFDRKKLILFTQTSLMLLSFILAVVTMMGKIQIWQIFILAVLMGIINAFDMPTRQSFVADMVGKKDLMNAIGLNALVLNGARMLGPAIAGILISAYGEGFCFLINAVSYLAVLIAIVLVTPLWQNVDYIDETLAQKVFSGIDYMLNSKKILLVIILLAVTGFTTGFIMILMPVFVKDIYHLNASGFGIFMASMGLGSLLGGITLASKKDASDIRKIVFYSAMAFGVLIIFFSLTRIFGIAVFLLAAAGYLSFLQMGCTNTFIQHETTNEMRGRVMSFFVMAFMGFAPVGCLIGGFLTEKIGAPFTLALAGTFSFICALILWKREIKYD